MYAQLGNIQFDGLKGFSSFEQSYGTRYAEIPLIDGKPRLQRVGDELDEVTFTMLLHASFCDPEFEFQQLDLARRKGEVLPLINGEGLFYGDFVITEMRKGIVHTGTTGYIVHLEAQVTLREFHDASKDSSGLKLLQQNAFALGRSTSLRSVAGPVQAGMSVMEAIRRAKQAYTQVQTAVKTISTNPLKAAVLFAQAGSTTAGIISDLQGAQDILNLENNLNVLAPGLGTGLANSQIAAGGLGVSLAAEDLSASSLNLATLGGSLNVVNNAATPIVRKLGARRRP
jgi:phage protein U